MTDTRISAASTDRPRRKKAHPARTARTVSTAVAATLSFGLVGALSLSAASNASAPSASSPAPLPVAGPAVAPDIALLETPTVAPPQSATPPNTVVVLVRRIHYLPANTPTPLGSSGVASTGASASFTPKAARAVATPVRQRVARRALARRATTKAS